MRYWAHSDRAGLAVDNPKAAWQPLADHLANVSCLARKLAELAAPSDQHLQDMAAHCGLLHDFGKYSPVFQKMILSGTGRCQHAIHGAVVACFGAQGDRSGPALTHVALAVAGHHAGLPDIKGGSRSLEERVKQFRDEAVALVPVACEDSAQLRNLLQKPFAGPDKGIGSRFDLFTRMLFSCLIDADRFDSAGREMSSQPLRAAELLEDLLKYLIRLSDERPDGPVKSARHQVLADCLSAAGVPGHLLSLTVPTGGGKTLAAMAFALKRAALYPEIYRRVIVVIPYLSIIEQNASVYAEVFGKDAILEHHSGSFDPLTAGDSDHFVPCVNPETEGRYQSIGERSETENWDAPIIVTTSVRFFESLFSNLPSDLRRAHNVARAIVILDEVQTLPRRLLAPLLALIRELSDHWGCTFVFSTATQPAFERMHGSRPDGRWEPGIVREIVREPGSVRSALRRTEIVWEMDAPVPWGGLAQRILAEKQGLCVVNLRDHASRLFDEAVRVATDGCIDTSGLFHLSTRMCAAHRLKVLSVIRLRLQRGLPCWVISTQLVEAGVDLDFPIVFRALGPLDSVFQAAGRSDREGRLTADLGRPGGRVVVFLPEDNRLPPNEYKEATGKTAVLARDAIRRGVSLQVDSAEAIKDYFQRYYGENAPLGKDLEQMRQKAEFASLAENFEMISSRTRDVFVPYGDYAVKAIGQLRVIGKLTRELRRALQRYVVGLYPQEFQRAQAVLEQVRPEEEIWVALEQGYSEGKGLNFEVRAEDLVI